MRSLIKKDLLSLKSIAMIVIPITVLFLFFIGWYISRMSGFRYNDLSGIVLFIALFNLLMSYGLMTHICRTEELSGIHKRIWKLPISVPSIVLAKFCSLLIIAVSINVITFGALFFVQVILGHSVGVGNAGSVILFFNALILLFISFYLFFHLSFGSYVATWIGCLFIFGAIFLPMFWSVPTGVIFGRPLATIEPLLNQFFFIITLLLTVVSILFSIWNYHNYLNVKKKIYITASFIGVFFFLMITMASSAFAMSSPPLNTKKSIIEHISVERLNLELEKEGTNYSSYSVIQYEVVLTASHLSDPRLLDELGISLVFLDEDPLFSYVGPEWGTHYGSWSYHQSQPTFTLFGSISVEPRDVEQIEQLIGESRPQIAIYENFHELVPIRVINY
ncbi:ABC-2 transporter permease [Alkalihalobacterium alkalinitrilicum]|uniref:ABC-2 transporter permease n=1 Tax=Alkalihalobacterium alkalinitrilicum TaxID=427920 RepID=UPI000995716D|nr:ABC-2 transporter permease [Alkalihalobacterium alkalinitrilicum]